MDCCTFPFIVPYLWGMTSCWTVSLFCRVQSSSFSWITLSSGAVGWSNAPKDTKSAWALLRSCSSSCRAWKTNIFIIYSLSQGKDISICLFCTCSSCSSACSLALSADKDGLSDLDAASLLSRQDMKFESCFSYLTQITNIDVSDSRSYCLTLIFN